MTNEIAHLTGADLQQELLPRVVALRSYVERKIPDRLRRLVSVDDILQDLWIAAYRNAATFKPDGPRAIDRWLSTIATSKIVDAIRAARRVKRGGGRRHSYDAQRRMTSLAGLFERVQSPTKTPSSDARCMERAHAVSIALNRLSEDRQRAVCMHYVEGLSCPEIADRLDTSAEAVHSLIYNGLRDLRRFLGEAAEYFSDIKSTESSRR